VVMIDICNEVFPMPTTPAPANPQPKHGGRCRDAAIVSMQMLIEQVKQHSENGVISVEQVAHIGHALMRSDVSLMNLYNKHSADCVVMFERIKNQKPTDYMARVLMEPLTAVFAEKTNKIPAKALPRILSAFQMILGMERYNIYAQRLTNRATVMKGSGPEVHWPNYFQDRAVTATMMSCQVAIARSFESFGQRMKWFITIVNREPTPAPGEAAVEDKLEMPFKKDDFVKIMYAMFANVRPENFDDAARDAFFDKYEVFPDAVFGPIFANLIKAQESDFFAGEEVVELAVAQPAPVADVHEEEKAPEVKKKRSLLGMFG